MDIARPMRYEIESRRINPRPRPVRKEIEMDNSYGDDLSVGLRKAGGRVRVVAWILGVMALLLSIPNCYALCERNGFPPSTGPYTILPDTAVLLLPIGGLLMILVCEAVKHLCNAVAELLDRQ